MYNLTRIYHILTGTDWLALTVTVTVTSERARVSVGEWSLPLLYCTVPCSYMLHFIIITTTLTALLLTSETATHAPAVLRFTSETAARRLVYRN